MHQTKRRGVNMVDCTLRTKHHDAVVLLEHVIMQLCRLHDFLVDV